MQRKSISRLENEQKLVMQALSDTQYFAAIYDHYYPGFTIIYAFA